MKEKLRNLFDEMKVRSRYKSMGEIINMIDPIINQEVEKRIAERMPSDVKDSLNFTEWVAKQITIENLEYNYSDEIWFYQSDVTDNKIRQYTTHNLLQLFLHRMKFRSRLASQKTEGGGE